MQINLQNEQLTVAVNTVGAELTSVRGNGVEYLWQGDEAYWNGQAPNLFPTPGRLTGGKYAYRGKEYAMPIHGFARSQEFAVAARGEDYVELELTENAETLAQYPFAFRLRIRHALEGPVLVTTYTVENTGGETLYYGLGAHPGFNLPLEAGLRFEDYELDFGPAAPAASPTRVGFAPSCLVNGDDTPYPLANGRTLPLRHNLFDDDALFLYGMPPAVTLQSKGARKVVAEYAGFAYLGLWHANKTDAPYLCIEPWTALPSRDGIVEDLENQQNLPPLAPGAAATHTLRFSFL